jgi:hypothetical protein
MLFYTKKESASDVLWRQVVPLFKWTDIWREQPLQVELRGVGCLSGISAQVS